MEENVYKKKEKMKIHQYFDGWILPRKFEKNAPMWGYGGVCTKEKEFVDASFYDGGWAKHGGKYAWDSTEEVVQEKVIYIGIFFAHWGHFLVDLTSRLWIFTDNTFDCSNYKVAYLGEEEPEGNYLEFFKLLGISENQLIHVKKPTKFQEVIVPQQGFRPCIWYTEEFQHMFDVLVAKSICDQKVIERYGDAKRIYFTRGNFGKAKATEFGEGYMEQCFCKQGYVSIAPENLSLKEQIYVWNNAKQIVCMNGSIPLNVAFSKNEKLELLILNKMSLYHKNPYIFLQMRNIKAQFINVYKEPFHNYPKSLGEGPYFIYPGKEFREYCRIHHWRYPESKIKFYVYYLGQGFKYILSILNIKGKFRNLISRMVPKGLKERLRGVV